jgi:hypothetical protein
METVWFGKGGCELYANWHCGGAVGRKKALLFEKRSKNFCLLVRAVDPTLT